MCVYIINRIICRQMWSHNHGGFLCCQEKQESSQTLEVYNCETYVEKVGRRWIFKIVDQWALIAKEILADMFSKHAVKGAVLTKSEHVRDIEKKLRLSDLKISSPEPTVRVKVPWFHNFRQIEWNRTVMKLQSSVTASRLTWNKSFQEKKKKVSLLLWIAK